MATAKTAPFEELTKLASDFVTTQKGMWDHTAWMDFLGRVQQKGGAISADMQSHLGDLLEAMKDYHTAVSSTEDVEKAMSTVFNESVAFVQRQKGVWGHEEWEDFVTTIRANTLTWFEGMEAYLGGVLESLKVFYALSPPETGREAASAPKVTRPAQQDDLTAIPGLGPVLAEKLNKQGIQSYAQLAALTDEDIAHLEKNVIKFAGRITRYDWVGHAKKLAGE